VVGGFSLRGPRDRKFAQHKGAQLADGAYLLDFGIGNFYPKKILHEKHDLGDSEGIEAEILDEPGVIGQRAGGGWISFRQKVAYDREEHGIERIDVTRGEELGKSLTHVGGKSGEGVVGGSRGRDGH
jgi:hypothetical protein